MASTMRPLASTTSTPRAMASRSAASVRAESVPSRVSNVLSRSNAIIRTIYHTPCAIVPHFAREINEFPVARGAKVALRRKIGPLANYANGPTFCHPINFCISWR